MFTTTKHNNRAAHVATLDSVGDFLALASQPAAANFQGKPASRKTSQPDWYGTSTFEEAMYLAKTGWPAGRAAFVKDIAAIGAPPTSYGAAMGYDVAGAYPDVCRAIAGDPMNMVTPADDPTSRGRVITLRVWTGVSSAVDAATVRAWGAAICSHVDALEGAGWRVDLWQVDTCVKVGWADASPLMFIQHRIKDASQAVDLDAIAFSFSNVAWSRRLTFAAKETLPATAATMNSNSYGVPQYSAEFEPGKPFHWAADAISVPGVPAGMTIDIPGANTATPGATPKQCAERLADILKTGLEKTGAFDAGTGMGDAFPDARAA